MMREAPFVDGRYASEDNAVRAWNNQAVAVKNESLKVENAKLRDAVAILWKCCAWETNSIGWCDECDYHDEDDGGCKVEKVLRELGIEVDDGDCV